MKRTVVAMLAGVAMLTAPPAKADDQGFLDYIYAHGVPNHYGLATPGDYTNRKVGEMICDIYHHGGGPNDVPFLGWQQNNYRDILIDGAQHQLCPDTLH